VICPLRERVVIGTRATVIVRTGTTCAAAEERTTIKGAALRCAKGTGLLMRAPRDCACPAAHTSESIPTVPTVLERIPMGPTPLPRQMRHMLMLLHTSLLSRGTSRQPFHALRAAPAKPSAPPRLPRASTPVQDVL
jgi:hypothetical protein